jgi:hypothetical protein
MIEGKKTAGRPRNSYIGQIKCDAKVKTFKELIYTYYYYIYILISKLYNIHTS